MAPREAFEAFDRTGVIRDATRQATEDRLQAREKILTLRPMFPGDQYARRQAVESGIVDNRRGDVFRLGLKLGRRVVAGDDDPRRDVAQFAGDRLVEQRLVV